MRSGTRTRQRLAFWRRLRASQAVAQQLEALCRPLPPPTAELPLPDEPQTAYYRSLPTAGRDLYQRLLQAFPQLAFEPEPGVAASEAWVRAVRRGEAPTAATCPLRAPEALQLRLVSTPAGSLPALVAGCREDFVLLMQLLAHRGEPKPISPSHGASLVQGLPNWERFRALRQEWQRDHPAGDWAQAWPQLAARKELYQDRLVLASWGPYSGVAHVPGLAPAAWQEASLRIRLAHEATHYLTLRAFGRLGHTVLEELVADWVGVGMASQGYSPHVARQFLGLEAQAAGNADGRLRQYVPSGVSEEAFSFLAQAMQLAIQQLARLPWPGEEGLASLLPPLLAASLEDLASGWSPPGSPGGVDDKPTLA